MPNLQQKTKELEATNRTLKNDKQVMADDKIKNQKSQLDFALSHE